MMPVGAEHKPFPGTRPAGAQDESVAARRVREMFARIAPRYDLLNHLLSFGLDFTWRRRTARRFRHILARPGVRVLDLCCGTGDLALALARRATGDAVLRPRAEVGQQRISGAAEIVGADFAHPMLVRARAKTNAGDFHGPGAVVCFLEADALQLPFADSSFDLVTAAFGFRNLANYQRGVREIHRVLRPGAEVGILEFAQPRGLLAPWYRFYFCRVLPRIGRLVSGDDFAYSYLPASVETFPRPEDLSLLFAENGFTEVHFQLWTAGAVALHTARKKIRAQA